MNSSILLLLGLICFCSAQTYTNINIGTAVNAIANTPVSVAYLGGAALTIQVNKNATVTLSDFVNVQVSLPNGFQSLSFGLQVGFSLNVTPSDAVVVSASLTTPALTVAAAALLTGGANAGVLQFDTSANAYSYVQIQSYSLLDQTVTVPLPSAGVYIFVAIQQNVQLPALFNHPQDVPANQNKSYSFPSGLGLVLQTVSNSVLNVNFSSQSSHSGLSGQTAVSGFFQLDLNNSNSFDATLQWQYTAADIAGVDEASLKFSFYDEVNGVWTVPSSGGSVDTQAKIVTQVTTHFSEWTVSGTPTSSSSPANVLQVSVAVILALIALISL